MGERQYKMKEVLSILEGEYQGINASALRFWDRKGLIKPSGKTSSHHRRYTEKDIDIVRFVKDLSNFGYSLNEIGKELSSVRNKIESEKINEIKPELYSTTYAARIFMHHRSRKNLSMRLKLYLNMDDSARYTPTFKRRILAKRIKDNTLSDFIKKMDNLGLTKPKEMDRGFLYSSCDEVILETLIYILEEQKDFLKRYKKFIGAVEYLYEEIGPTARLTAGPVMSLDLSTYKALLYNLIQERLSYEENERKKKKKREERKSNELSRSNCKDS